MICLFFARSPAPPLPGESGASRFTKRVRFNSAIGTIALAAAAIVLPIAPLPAQAAGAATPPAAGTGTVTGTALDSLRGGTLEYAIVQLPALRRETVTGKDGRFSFANVPEGKYKLRMLHTLLDTIGIMMESPEFAVAAGQTKAMDISVPRSDQLVDRFCPGALRVRGPAAVIGFVRDPDNNDSPVDSAKVQLFWEDVDVSGLVRTPRIRDAILGADGRFKICGLPERMNGKVQIFRRGVPSGEVEVKLDDELLALRGLTFAKANQIVSIAGDSGKMLKVLRGNARLVGKVVNDKGEPVAGARVSVPGTLSAGITALNGTFALDSLPSGSHGIQVRKIGFGVTDKPIELSAVAVADVTVMMDKFVATLPTVRVIADRYEKGLEDTGFNARRKKNIGGFFLEGDKIDKQAMKFSDVLRTIPGLKITRVEQGDSQDNQIRVGRLGFLCLHFVVDGHAWKSMSDNDMDYFLQADEVQAIEFYHSNAVPIEFQLNGTSACPVVVIWTRSKIPPKRGG
jgi:hypothetical protein